MNKILIFLFIVVSFSYAQWGSVSEPYGQLKYSFEDSVKHDRLLQCNEIARAGGNNPEIFEVNIGNSKQIRLNYQTFSAKDIIIIEYENQTIFDSGCVGTSNWRNINLSTSGYTSQVTVKVLPNCKGTEPSTRWEFSIDCK